MPFPPAGTRILQRCCFICCCFIRRLDFSITSGRDLPSAALRSLDKGRPFRFPEAGNTLLGPAPKTPSSTPALQPGQQGLKGGSQGAGASAPTPPLQGWPEPSHMLTFIPMNIRPLLRCLLAAYISCFQVEETLRERTSTQHRTVAQDTASEDRAPMHSQGTQVTLRPQDGPQKPERGLQPLPGSLLPRRTNNDTHCQLDRPPPLPIRQSR